MSETVAYQHELSFPEPKVVNNKEYTEQCEMLDQIDLILMQSGSDLDFAKDYLRTVQSRRSEAGATTELSNYRICVMTRHAVKAYRCMILRYFLGKPYRELSILIAGSAHLRGFCHIEQFKDEIRVPSKSSLNRFNKLFTEKFLRGQVVKLIEQSTCPKEVNPLGLTTPVFTDDVFIDATCLSAKIHYPVDWLLLKDCILTIIQAIIVIRSHGIKYRIKTPEEFISEINAHCMTMASHNRKKDSKKNRKKTYTKMRNLSQKVRTHGCSYIRELEERWEEESDLSEGEKNVIVKRIQGMVDILPEAIDQADTRIRRGELVDNKDKLLSVYHHDINIIKRGKAGGNYEFGNPLFIAEQADGLILDWKLYRTDVKEVNATPECINRITEEYGFDIRSVTGDRGCQSAKNDKFLDGKDIFSGLCPRSPLEMVAKLQDPKFQKLQKRRAQTEGRIGIIKNDFLSGSLYEREFDDKEVTVAWAVLTHNLWKLARMVIDQKKELEKAA